MRGFAAQPSPGKRARCGTTSARRRLRTLRQTRASRRSASPRPD